MKRIFTLLTFFISILRRNTLRISILRISMLSIYTLSICTLSVAEGYGQLTGDNYPVQAHVYVQRPSLKMPEYFSSSTMLRTDLILKDLTKTTLDVYLSWQITGLGLGIEAGTLPGFVPLNYLTLTKGSKRLLSGIDLREYFQPGILAVSGVGENVIFNGKLPEGFYTLKITAYEAGTGRQVSNTAETFFSVAYALPPVINLPLIGSEQPVTRPQNVLLQWMPRHTATGSNSITYSGKVCEVAEDEDPNIAVNGSQNCFTIPAQTGTSYLLKASDLPLKVGKRYAFQIQVTDNNEQLEFQNQGYSEVSWFRFGEACKPPTGLQVNAIAAGRLNVSWNANPEATGYKLFYRSKNQTDWTEQTTLGTSVSLVSLNPELDYEFKVLTICEPGNESPESETVTWEGEGEIDDELEGLINKVLNPLIQPISTSSGSSTSLTKTTTTTLPEKFEDLIPKDPTKIPCNDQLDSYENCSDVHPTVDIDAGDLTPNLKVGDLVTIYDYFVVLTDISDDSPFSGKGLAQMPFLDNAKVPVEFSNVIIKQKDPGVKGGCVTEVNGHFRVRNGLTPEQIRQEEIDLIHTVRKSLDPGSIYISRDQVITELGEELTTTGKDLCDGKPITEEAKQSLLKKHTLAKQGLEDWAEEAADLYSELDLDGTEILSRIQALITTLEANIAIINSGEGCPENPDIKAEMDAITRKIKEDLNGNPEKELNDFPVISNIEVKNITSSTAAISWKGDKRFTKYLVSYQKPGESLVVKEVTGTSLKLADLLHSSLYNIEITGMIDGEYKQPYPWFFVTLGDEFPKPKNLVAEDINSNTVRISWGEDIQHKKYKLVYRNSKGEVKEVYPSNNYINIPNIDFDDHFTYEVIAYDQSGTKSASETNKFTSPNVCKYLNLTADKRSIIKGGTVTLEVGDRCEEETVIWYKNGEQLIGMYGNTLQDKPIINSEYKVFCDIKGFGNQKDEGSVPYTCAETVSILVEDLCSNNLLIINPTVPNLGEQVLISLTGCNGKASLFKKEKNSPLEKISDKSYLYYTVTENVEIFGECINGEASCTVSETINMGCGGFGIVSSPLNGVNYGSDQWEKVDKGLGFNSIGCTGYVYWNFHDYPSKRIKYNLDGYEVMILNIEKNESSLSKVTATCSSNGCIKELELEKPKRNCFKIYRKLERLTFESRNYYQLSIVGDLPKAGGNIEVTWSPQKNRITNYGGVLEELYNHKYIDELNKQEVYKARYKYYDNLIGNKVCEYFWVLDPEKNNYPENTNEIPFEIPCEPFTLSASKIEITRGEPVLLTVAGCPASVITWVNGKEGENLPLETKNYEAKCSVEGKELVSTVTVNVNDPVFTITPTEVKNHSYKSELVITAKNCTDGYPGSTSDITWNTGAKGNSIKVYPDKSIEYRAFCTVNGQLYGTGICKVTVTDPPTYYGPLYPPDPCDFRVTVFPQDYLNDRGIVKLTVNGCQGSFTAWYKGFVIWDSPSTEQFSIREKEITVDRNHTDIKIICQQYNNFCESHTYLNFGPSVSYGPLIYIDRGNNDRLNKEECHEVYLKQNHLTFKFPVGSHTLREVPGYIKDKLHTIAAWYVKDFFADNVNSPQTKLAIADKGCSGKLTWYNSSSRTSGSLISNKPENKFGYGVIYVNAPSASKITYYGRCVYPNDNYCDVSITLDKDSEKPLISGLSSQSQTIDTGVQNIAEHFSTAVTENEDCGYSSTREVIKKIFDELICKRLSHLLPKNPTAAETDQLSRAVIATLESLDMFTLLTVEDVKRIINSQCNGDVLDEILAYESDAPVNTSDFIEKLQEKEIFDKLLSEKNAENKEALSIEVSTKSPTCLQFNGEIRIRAFKGSLPYQYSIDGGKVFSSDESSFDNLSAGVYTVVVKDAAGDIQRKVIDLKDNSASSERLTMSTYTSDPQAAMGALAVTGELTVQFDPNYTPATVSPVQGVTLTHLSGGIVKLETTLEEYKQWEGEYGAYFKADRNVFAGLYKLDYAEGCSTSGFMSDCKELCFEGFLSQPLIRQNVPGMSVEAQGQGCVETTPNTFKMGDILVSFKPGINVDCLNEETIQITTSGGTTETYTLLVYQMRDKTFAGFYRSSSLIGIPKNQDGTSWDVTKLNENLGNWLLSEYYEHQNYTRFKEDLFAELEENLFDKIDALFDKIPCFVGDLTFYEDGIVPECLWRGHGIPLASRAAGAIDGAYKMGVGLNELPPMVNKLTDYISEAIFGQIGCEDEYHDKLKKIGDLEAVLQKKYANKKWYSAMSEWWTEQQIETHIKDLAFCNSYFDFLKTLDVLLTLASDWNTYVKSLDQVHEGIDKYVESLANGLGEDPTSLTDEQNHYFGKQIFDIATLFVSEVRIGQVLTDYRMALSTLPRLPKTPALELIKVNSNGIAFRVFDHTATESRLLYEMTASGAMTNVKWAQGNLGRVEVIETLYNYRYIGQDGVERVGNLELLNTGGSRGNGLVFRVRNGSSISSLQKLNGNASSQTIAWRNLDDKNIIWSNPHNNALSTAKSFTDETGTALYDGVFNGGHYVKFDLNDGRILLGNTDGSYHAFAVLTDAELGAFKVSVLNVSDEVFNEKLSQLLTSCTDRLLVISGVISKQVNIAGKMTTLSSTKVNTILGRYRPDISNLFDELGSFKNVGLGEKAGGINILNKPDYYYDVSNWWNVYNKPWLERALTRGDDIYLATIPQKSDDIIREGKLIGAYSQELKLLTERNKKPINITSEEWTNIKNWLKN